MADTVHDMAARVISRATASGQTIVTAESCTGGGIGAALTSAPGSSKVFLGGMLAYSNRVKQDFLSISNDLLVAHGAVSAPVAKAMADNVRRAFGAGMAVSATGIAGPGGGTETKPVGLVYVGVSVLGQETLVTELRCGDIGREAVREKTVMTALEVLGRGIIET